MYKACDCKQSQAFSYFCYHTLQDLQKKYKKRRIMMFFNEIYIANYV